MKVWFRFNLMMSRIPSENPKNGRPYSANPGKIIIKSEFFSKRMSHCMTCIPASQRREKSNISEHGQLYIYKWMPAPISQNTDKDFDK